MKTIITSFAVLCFFLISCSNTTSEKTNKQPEFDSREVHQQDTETQSIELNNGKKWKVDENMLVHIRNMEKDVNSFSNAEQKGYQSFAKKLQPEIDLLTSNCTMNGKAHDELHKWLLPYIDLVKELSEAKDETEATKQFENIQSSFKTFNQYFQ